VLTDSAVESNAVEGGEGGGLLNQSSGNLTVSGCLVSANSADGQGAGIRNLGALAGIGSTLSFNTGGSYGGAISNGGDAQLTGCTLSSNTAEFWGAGAINWGVGPQTMTLFNCTVSGNATDTLIGGGLSNFDTMTLSHTTVTGNTSGLENLGTLNAKNCIVVGNSFADCNEPANVATGRNYHSDGTCGAGFTLATLAQVRLAPLAWNGGPTETHALFRGSVALDQALDCSDFFGNAVRTDQRGIARPQGTACDVGSFERASDRLPSTPPTPSWAEARE
jgi:hypothetical protein